MFPSHNVAPKRIHRFDKISGGRRNNSGEVQNCEFGTGRHVFLFDDELTRSLQGAAGQRGTVNMKANVRRDFAPRAA